MYTSNNAVKYLGLIVEGIMSIRLFDACYDIDLAREEERGG
jgi:hypothetical protein